MPVTPAGMVVLLQPRINVWVSVSMMALQSFLESYLLWVGDTLMDSTPWQESKAFSPISVIRSEMMISFGAEFP